MYINLLYSHPQASSDAHWFRMVGIAGSGVSAAVYRRKIHPENSPRKFTQKIHPEESPKITRKKIGKTAQAIIDAMIADSTVTRKGLADLLWKSEDTIKYHLATLQAVNQPGPFIECIE